MSPIALVTLGILLAACSVMEPTISPKPSTAPETAPTADSPTQLPTVTTTLACSQQLIPPALLEARPAEPAPGGVVTIIGSGGYLQDNCGGVNESARAFKLYLDRNPAAEMTCYINHCEGKVTLDPAISPDQHCLSLQADGCDLKIQVTP
jgi:hypothetical protein